jgi:hypothetical protein
MGLLAADRLARLQPAYDYAHWAPIKALSRAALMTHSSAPTSVRK